MVGLAIGTGLGGEGGIRDVEGYCISVFGSGSDLSVFKFDFLPWRVGVGGKFFDSSGSINVSLSRRTIGWLGPDHDGLELKFKDYSKNKLDNL